ncbi:MAG: Flp family type IVb pilin [Chlorobiaceae bacterium]|nr:Flp family type IVb pilin [Chlorobiaceae bacterium]
MSSNLLAVKMVFEAFLNKHFSVKSQKGVTMIEYALIAALIAVAAIAILPGLGDNLSTTFETVSDNLD